MPKFKDTTHYTRGARYFEMGDGVLSLQIIDDNNQLVDINTFLKKNMGTEFIQLGNYKGLFFALFKYTPKYVDWLDEKSQWTVKQLY